MTASLFPQDPLTEEDEAAPAGVPLEEQAYRSLRQALVEGVFAPGEKLSIRRIASSLGTSPMPARTALRRLAAEQAVDVLPSGTAIVPRLTRQSFRELGEIRASLEPLAVRLAAPQIASEALDRLEWLLTEHEEARAGGRADDLLRLDREFLFTVYRQAGSPMLLGLIEVPWLRRGPLFWEARWALMARPQETGHRHPAILAALRAADGLRAARELEEEIRDATSFLLKEMRFADDAATPGLPALGKARAAK
ncbi:GntR family transcriptional regulator [Pseudoroseomonas globiformis]|uniref:GntR family transcriptional regulator n=1 Tax=Teichococcus globiformis TaxID=2307229 RepID=A0ABV7G0K8_9PROT